VLGRLYFVGTHVLISARPGIALVNLHSSSPAVAILVEGDPMFAHQVDCWRRAISGVEYWCSSIRVAGVWSSLLVVVRAGIEYWCVWSRLLVVVHRIRSVGPGELSIHSFGVCGRRMFVVLVCSCCSYVHGGGGQRCHVVLRVWLLVARR